MALSQAAQTAVRELDEKLTGAGKSAISVALGVNLYREMWNAGMLPKQDFGKPGFPGEVWNFPSYGKGVWVIWNPDLAPYQVRVGDGGVRV